MLITSLDNEKVKKYIKLKNKKYRDKYSQFIIEGEHLVLEAYKAGMLDVLLLEEDCNFKLDSCDTIYLSSNILAKISSVDTPQKVMGICHKKDECNEVKEKYLLLDGIQDPGNLGTIIRSSVAFGIDKIILSNNTVDLYNPKAIRSTQGMLFHIDIIRKDLKEEIAILKKNNIPVYGTKVDEGIDVRELSLKEKEQFALIVGNEGNGISEEIQRICDKNLYINMNKNVESLNVGVAASILLYELGR